MALELRNQFGQLTLENITDADVAALSEPAQLALSKLIPCVQRRQAAQERFNKAVRAKHKAEAEQVAALEAHQAANPPISFQQAQAAAIAAFNKSN